MRPLEERHLMVEPGHGQLSIARQCALLSISRSGFYGTPCLWHYQGVPESPENLAILRMLDEQYFCQRHGLPKTPFYGVERLLVLLVVQGYSINRKRLRRLMKVQGWKTLYCAPRTTRTDPAAYAKGMDSHKYPYLLKGVSIERKNQAWGIDITYIPMKNGFMYLCAIIDIHTRFVVGWGISNSMTAEWVTEIVYDAMGKHGSPVPKAWTPKIINSDQGSQFMGVHAFGTSEPKS